MFEQTFKNIDDILHKDAGCTSELDYTEQSSWLLFLKYLDALEADKATEAALDGKKYKAILDDAFRWQAWAAPKDAKGKLDHNNAMTGEDLLQFVNGVAVRPAALQADGDVRSAAWFALDRVGAWQHGLDQRNTFGNSFARAPRILNIENAKVIAFSKRTVRQPCIDLIRLAAQANHEYRRKIGMGGIARQRAL